MWVNVFYGVNCVGDCVCNVTFFPCNQTKANVNVRNALCGKDYWEISFLIKIPKKWSFCSFFSNFWAFFIIDDYVSFDLDNRCEKLDFKCLLNGTFFAFAKAVATNTLLDFEKLTDSEQAQKLSFSNINLDIGRRLIKLAFFFEKNIRKSQMYV